jgi:copper homeostasis protein (lipoprotein)
MRRVCFVHLCWILLPAFVFTACDSGEKTQSVPAANPYEEISGVYADTLPCADCSGILTELTLFSDSTFAMRERYLGAAAAQRGLGSYGSFLIQENGRVKLIALHDQWVRYFKPVNEDLLALDTAGNEITSALDYTLERTDEVADSTRRQGFRNMTGAANGLVFRKSIRGEVMIDAEMIKSSGEAMQALIAWYALAHEVGCKGPECPVNKALGKDDAAMKAMVAKWIPGNEKVSDVLKTGLRSGDLQLLHVFEEKDIFRVSSVVVTPTGTERRDDVFRLVNGTLIWESGTKGEIKYSTSSKNPNRPKEYQEGGKQVIDMKRLKQNPKKGSDGK